MAPFSDTLISEQSAESGDKAHAKTAAVMRLDMTMAHYLALIASLEKHRTASSAEPDSSTAFKSLSGWVR